MTRVAILRFPGTWSERDFEHAFTLVPGVETEILWHADADLKGFDAAIVPGGFAYGDYLRAGAIAKISPAAKELRRFAAEGGAILGSCNGFQILCEIGLLPGALVRNDHLEFRCDWVRMRVESDRTPWTRGLKGEFLRMPIAQRIWKPLHEPRIAPPSAANLRSSFAAGEIFAIAPARR